jgi:hypothetical protein
MIARTFRRRMKNRADRPAGRFRSGSFMGEPPSNQAVGAFCGRPGFNEHARVDWNVRSAYTNVHRDGTSLQFEGRVTDTFRTANMESLS